MNKLYAFAPRLHKPRLNNYLDQPKLDGKEIQINMTGFLQKNTSLFMKELWTLMRDAMTSDHGIPPQLLELESKKRELEKEQFEKTRVRVFFAKNMFPFSLFDCQRTSDISFMRMRKRNLKSLLPHFLPNLYVLHCTAQLAVLARQQEIEAALRRQREEQERAYRESIDKSRAAVEAHRQCVAAL